MSKIYSYAEYLPIAKVGDVVRAVKGKHNGCGELEDDGSNTQKITQINKNFFEINGCWHTDNDNSFLELVSSLVRIPTWEDLQVNDELNHKNVGTVKVLEVGASGKTFLRSHATNHAMVYAWKTIQEAQEEGWSLVTPPEVEEMTLEAVNKLLGKKVKIVE